MPLSDLEPQDENSLKGVAKALAALEELRRREAEREAKRGKESD